MHHYIKTLKCRRKCTATLSCVTNNHSCNTRGPIFKKSHDELTKKSDLRKTQDEHAIIKKLQKSYEKLATLQVSYENVKFAASDVIRVTLCQRLLWSNTLS